VKAGPAPPPACTRGGGLSKCPRGSTSASPSTSALSLYICLFLYFRLSSSTSPLVSAGPAVLDPPLFADCFLLYYPALSCQPCLLFVYFPPSLSMNSQINVFQQVFIQIHDTIDVYTAVVGGRSGFLVPGTGKTRLVFV
jgi:hypothetical protein